MWFIFLLFTGRTLGNSFFRHWHCIGIKSQMDITKPQPIQIGELPLVLWKNTLIDEFQATINICKHMGSKLDSGKIVNGCLKCPYHGLEFTDKDTFGKIIEQDGKIFWSYDPIRPRPFAIPFYNSPRFAKSIFYKDMDCSLEDSAYNTMDIRHPEFVHKLAFGSSQSPQDIKQWDFYDKNRNLERVGLFFRYQSNELMKQINGNIASTDNFHMYINPTFTWSRVTFAENNLFIAVNLLPLSPKSTRWYITVLHDHRREMDGRTFYSQLAGYVAGQDFDQMLKQAPETPLKKAILFQHIFPEEEAILSVKRMLQDYQYPSAEVCAKLYNDSIPRKQEI
jgi:phenylpropionate dioxygenase-like ring-hydroxylating dioxygenase large terminal subunit